LASPAIPTQRLSAELFVQLAIQSQGANALAGVGSRRLPGHMVQKDFSFFARKELEKP
jgi:hypothetical protein